MKKLFLAFAILLAIPAYTHAQIKAAAPVAATPAPSTPPQNIYAAGISYNQSATPEIAGTGLYARAVDASIGTYAFTAVDALPNSTRPFTVTTNMSVGIAQKVFSIGSVPIYIPTAAGISWTGSNTGWAWSTGALASVRLGKSNWRLMPMVRFARSSVSGSGIQPIGGVLIGWGK